MRICESGVTYIIKREMATSGRLCGRSYIMPRGVVYLDANVVRDSNNLVDLGRCVCFRSVANWKRSPTYLGILTWTSSSHMPKNIE